MKLIIPILLATLTLTSCDSPNSSGTPSSGNSGGLLNSMASGVATGAGIAAGHHLINGAANKWQERKAARSIASARQYSGFNRMSRSYRR